MATKAKRKSAPKRTTLKTPGAFAPAAPAQSALKIALYGPPGSGKTFTALLWAEHLAQGKRIAMVDTERGTDWYSQSIAERRVHPQAFAFDALYTRSLAETLEAVAGLDPAVYGVVIVDSISHLWDSAIEAYEGQLTGADTIPMQAWGKIKRPYKALISQLMSSPLHAMILGRQKNVFEDSGGQLKKVGVTMKAEGETPYEPHICVRMEARKDAKDPTKSTILGWVEKDRTGILQGSTLANPNGATLDPLLPYLGAVQAPSEDEDERLAKDAELLAADEQKKKQKVERSAALFSEYRSLLAGAIDLSELSTVAAELKKKRRYLQESHRNALGELYKDVRDKLAAQAAPEGV